jgi:hypothetical protein
MPALFASIIAVHGEHTAERILASKAISAVENLLLDADYPYHRSFHP